MATRELDLEQAKPVTADDLRARLRRKFPANQFAMLYEVRDAAGFGASRSADAVIVGLWPSRGCQVEGVEIKVSRTDWLRELARPEKAEAFTPYCDRWWVCAASDKVVQNGELPPTWGLMIPRGRGLVILKEAPRLKPEPVDRSFLAAMLKRATGVALENPEIQAAIASAVKQAEETVRSNLKWEHDRDREKRQELERALAEFQKASGVEIRAWCAGDIGRAVQIVLRGEDERVQQRLHDLKDQARRVLAAIEEAIPDDPAAEASDG